MQDASAHFVVSTLVVRVYRKIGSVTCNTRKIGKIDLFYCNVTISCDLSARLVIGLIALLGKILLSHPNAFVRAAIRLLHGVGIE
jgi:hypothetical protein